MDYWTGSTSCWLTICPQTDLLRLRSSFLDPVSSQVKVLSAGHGPILWYQYAADQFENLEAQGIPLGMIAGVKYSQANQRRLAPGDMLVLVTDGFYEWEDPPANSLGWAGWKW